MTKRDATPAASALATDFRPGDDDALGRKGSAAYLDVSTSTFDRQVASGVYPSPFYPSPRLPRWWRGDLRRALEARRMTVAQAKELRLRPAREREAQRRTAAAGSRPQP